MTEFMVFIRLFWDTLYNLLYISGSPTSLYDLVVSPDVAVLQGCGLGGTSLINANVGLDCEPRIFEDEVSTELFQTDDGTGDNI